jgi:meiotically up-regulated gene 157 (Mug157) protein
MAIAMQALTSTDSEEIARCVAELVATTAGTYVMHEAFNADDPGEYSRNFFTWPCSLFAYLYLTEILGAD